MPKISSTGEPSYEGHQGVVTNAVGEQFDVDPTRDLDGERKDGYTDEPVGDFEQSSPPGLSGPITQIDEENDEPVSDDERDESGRDNDQRPRLVDHRQSQGAGDSRKGTTAAKKATAPTSDATKK